MVGISLVTNENCYHDKFMLTAKSSNGMELLAVTCSRRTPRYLYHSVVYYFVLLSCSTWDLLQAFQPHMCHKLCWCPRLILIAMEDLMLMLLVVSNSVKMFVGFTLTFTTLPAI